MELASYAASEGSSYGRVYKDDNPSLRDQYQRDRDRVVHSSAFRRLEYKTQVFVNHEGDMFRTRLTHSLEVSQIGRTIARTLRLNEDLTEAICLAHDLGHTPFGHAGQDALNNCMKKHGGFEHNLQSLRVVDLLEEKYADFPGINLTFETREGILKHCSRKNAKELGKLGERFTNNTHPGLEAQLANIADEIAYSNHDIDDGIRSGLITVEQLCECDLFKEQFDVVLDQYGEINESRQINEINRRMINYMVTDLVNTSMSMIETNNIRSIEDARSAPYILIKLGETMDKKHQELKRFLRKNLYNHNYVEKMTNNAREVVISLFNNYIKDNTLLPETVIQRISDEEKSASNMDVYRVVSDYIAGMTDRFAIAEHQRVTKSESSIYDV